MGSASSKAAQGASRRYPKTPTSVTSSPVTRNIPPRASTAPELAEGKNKNPHAGQSDPDAITGQFSQRLQQMGVVEPNPTYSPSSTAASNNAHAPRDGDIGPRPLEPTFAPSRTNPTLAALEARRRLQYQAEAEFEALGASNSTGRQLIDMRTLVDAMALLNRGIPQHEVEERLNIQDGLLSKLGGPSTLSHESVTT